MRLDGARRRLLHEDRPAGDVSYAPLVPNIWSLCTSGGFTVSRLSLSTRARFT